MQQHPLLQKYHEERVREPIRLHIFAYESLKDLPKARQARSRDNWGAILTFVQILIVAQIGLNWDAYREKVSYFWENSVSSAHEKLMYPNKLPELGITGNEEEVEPLILDISPLDKRLIIPKIQQNVPIVESSSENLFNQDWNALEKEIQKDLQNGVVHYPTTAEPGNMGNMVISGHSSYYPWDPGRYKTSFALLDKMQTGDEFYVYDNQRKHTYRITEKKIIKATDVDVLSQEGQERVTLITCWPTGTNYKRLVVIGEPVE